MPETHVNGVLIVDKLFYQMQVERKRERGYCQVNMSRWGFTVFSAYESPIEDGWSEMTVIDSKKIL